MEKALAHLERANELLAFGGHTWEVGPQCGKGLKVEKYTNEVEKTRNCPCDRVYSGHRCKRTGKCILQSTARKYKQELSKQDAIRQTTPRQSESDAEEVEKPQSKQRPTRSAGSQHRQDIFSRTAPAVAGVVHFAEITRLSGDGPNKVYCVGELHGDQKADIDYVTEYKRLLSANELSENPVYIDLFLEVSNFSHDAFAASGRRDDEFSLWIDRLLHHMRGCYSNPEDMERFAGVIAEGPECPYKYTRVHWADPDFFDGLWSESEQKVIYGTSYQENPKWFTQAQKVGIELDSDKNHVDLQTKFPHVAEHIKGEEQLYNIVESNPFIADQLRRSIYKHSPFQTWFNSVIAEDKKESIDKDLVTEDDYWWRKGIYMARRIALDIYTFLRMTRRKMSARGRFENVIVHAGMMHTSNIVSLFRFIEKNDDKLDLYITERHTTRKDQTMNIDLCKVINFERKANDNAADITKKPQRGKATPSTRQQALEAEHQASRSAWNKTQRSAVLRAAIGEERDSKDDKDDDSDEITYKRRTRTVIGDDPEDDPQTRRRRRPRTKPS